MLAVWRCNKNKVGAVFPRISFHIALFGRRNKWKFRTAVNGFPQVIIDFDMALTLSQPCPIFRQTG